MDIFFNLILAIGISAGQMGSENYSEREWATLQMKDIINKYDIPELILPLLKSENPEIRLRAKQLWDSYWNPTPSEKLACYPKITTYNGVNDFYWKKNWTKAFYIYSSCSGCGCGCNANGPCGECGCPMESVAFWVSYGDEEKVSATRHFIRDKMKYGKISRKEAIRLLDEMVENERLGKQWMPELPSAEAEEDFGRWIANKLKGIFKP